MKNKFYKITTAIMALSFVFSSAVIAQPHQKHNTQPPHKHSKKIMLGHDFYKNKRYSIQRKLRGNSKLHHKNKQQLIRREAGYKPFFSLILTPSFIHIPITHK